MRPTLLFGHFDSPSLDKIFYKLNSRLRLIGREIGSGFPFALGVTCEHLADGQRIRACGIPERCPCGDFKLALDSLIPGNGERFPLRFRANFNPNYVRRATQESRLVLICAHKDLWIDTINIEVYTEIVSGEEG
jgi:hypothetical protein